MKYLLVLSMLLSFTLKAFAVTYITQIHSIDKGEQDRPHLILLSNGHTAFIENSQKSLVDDIQTSQERGDTVEIELDADLNVLAVKTVSPERVEPRGEEVLSGGMYSYEPSILDITTARNAFAGMRRDYQRESQCYNRAHIWSYEEYNRSGLKSNKLFLFFTTRYIRNYRYHWWFHVAPMVYVGDSEQFNWRVLDRRYTSGPLSTKNWTNIFMKNRATCPVVYNYSDYRNHQQSKDCYLIPTSMYFWQPRDIERQERTGYVKTQYYSSEVSHAYWEAF